MIEVVFGDTIPRYKPNIGHTDPAWSNAKRAIRGEADAKIVVVQIDANVLATLKSNHRFLHAHGLLHQHAVNQFVQSLVRGLKGIDDVLLRRRANRKAD